MKVVTTNNFKNYTSDIGTVQLTACVYYITTETITFKANTLDGVMNLWRFSSDKSTVLDVGRIG